MQHRRNIPRPASPATAKEARLELHPDRAFVLHLDVRAHLPRRMVCRVEHITSGRVAHVTSPSQLVAFMATALRDHVPSDRGGVQ